MFINKLFILFISLVQGQYLNDQAISSGSRTGNYINIEKYPYVVSIRFAKSRKVICTGILITFSWVLSVPYCFMLTPQHYKRKQDSRGIIPPDIETLARKKSKSISRRLAQGEIGKITILGFITQCIQLTKGDYGRDSDANETLLAYTRQLTNKINKVLDTCLRELQVGLVETVILIGFSENSSLPPQNPILKKQNSRFSRKYDIKINRIREKTPHYGPFSFNETLFTSTTENPLTEEELNKTVIHLEPKTFVIIAGASSLSDCFSAEGQARTGERIVVHPEFRLSMMKQRSPRHELALLKTNMPFIEHKSVHKAPVLHSFLLEKNPSRTCKLVGWGRGKTMKPLPHLKTTISEISVQLFNSSKCRFIENTYGKAVWDDDEDPWFCSYDEENNAIPVCQSDSGGPLVCNDRVVGLMSWLRSPICYYNRTEYIHTRPIYYCRIYSDLAWVRHVLGESSSRMSIQIENDSSSSVSIGISRYGLKVITSIALACFSLASR